jgi:hypothetical protein
LIVIYPFALQLRVWLGFLNNLQAIFHKRAGRWIKFNPPANVQKNPELIENDYSKKNHEDTLVKFTQAHWPCVWFIVE